MLYWRDPEYIEWAKKVKQRDDFRCKICGNNRCFLNSHHVRSWDIFTDFRYDLENGITLCQNCHNLFHQIFGRGKNTKSQFKQFQELRAIIRKILKAKQIESK